MNTTVLVTNMSNKDEIRSFVEEKMAAVRPAFGDMNLEPVTINVEVEYTTRHHRKGDRLFRAEANVVLPRGHLRVEEFAEDPRKAVVKMKHSLTRKVRTWREKKIDRRRRGRDKDQTQRKAV